MWHIGMFGTVPLYLLWTLLGSAWSCPPQEDIAPACTCRTKNYFSLMACSGLSSADELYPLIKATDSYNMFSLNIVDSSFMYIPSGVFKNTKYRSITFSRTQVMSLSESELAFEGLEDKLEDLRAKGAEYITQWDWSSLRKLRRLQLIDIHQISMYSLDMEFPALESLSNLGISSAEISFVHPRAFAHLENLQRLILQRNEISDMKRSMLPESAKRLFYIDLSYNKLRTLPSDFFSNLPILEEVLLAFNRFSTLNEGTFVWPFENLKAFYLTGNNFRCDCRLRWLVSKRKPFYFDGKCAEPEDMKNTSLKLMTESKLSCQLRRHVDLDGVLLSPQSGVQ